MDREMELQYEKMGISPAVFAYGEAVLDRLPTAEIVERDETGWTVEAEVFGKGIEMWLRSQGSYIS